MKKIIVLLTAIIFTSCGNNINFTGRWVEKKKENEIIIINKNRNRYIVEYRGNKYPAQIRDGLLEISAELPIKATIDENDVLIIGGDEFVRYENSYKYKYSGLWKRIDQNKDENGVCVFPNAIKFTLKNNNIYFNFGNYENKTFIQSLKSRKDFKRYYEVYHAYNTNVLRFSNGKITGSLKHIFTIWVEAENPNYSARGGYFDISSKIIMYKMYIMNNTLYIIINNPKCRKTLEYKKIS
jgi:hypothetical protein